MLPYVRRRQLWKISCANEQPILPISLISTSEPNLNVVQTNAFFIFRDSDCAIVKLHLQFSCNEADSSVNVNLLLALIAQLNPFYRPKCFCVRNRRANNYIHHVIII